MPLEDTAHIRILVPPVRSTYLRNRSDCYETAIVHLMSKRHELATEREGGSILCDVNSHFSRCARRADQSYIVYH